MATHDSGHASQKEGLRKGTIGVLGIVFFVVAAAAPPALAASDTKAIPAKPMSPCPEGWALAKPGVNPKTKAFSCTAKPGTKIPEPRIVCPGDLTYSENSKKGQLACRL